MKKIKILTGTLFGLPLGAIAGVWVGVTVNVWAGIAAFAVVFALTGWGFLTLAMKAVSKKNERYVELREEIAKTEVLRLDGLANYEYAGRLYQGRLFLTNEAFHFAGKQKGGEEKRFQLPLDDVAFVSRHKLSGNVENGLQLRMYDRRVYRFIVECPEEWIERITEPVPAQPDSDPTP